jgi:hypothetical protein
LFGFFALAGTVLVWGIGARVGGRGFPSVAAGNSSHLAHLPPQSMLMSGISLSCASCFLHLCVEPERLDITHKKWVILAGSVGAVNYGHGNFFLLKILRRFFMADLSDRDIKSGRLKSTFFYLLHSCWLSEGGVMAGISLPASDHNYSCIDDRYKNRPIAGLIGMLEPYVKDLQAVMWTPGGSSADAG